MDPLVIRAREVWEDLARVPVAFVPPGGVDVVVSPRSGLCPGGWVGVVTLGGSAIVTAPTDAVRGGHGRVVAAAGYRAWPGRAAHVGVLTAPEARGRGLARVTGSAAVAHALAAGLLPQWRARLPASRRVAAALGFEELGFQLSIELAMRGV